MLSGILVYWNPRGYGFIRQHRGAEGDFVHARHFDEAGISPSIGARYRYELATRRDGRTEAVNVAEVDDAAVEEAARVFPDA
jgi:cold shock CspA family protein